VYAMEVSQNFSPTFATRSLRVWRFTTGQLPVIHPPSQSLALQVTKCWFLLGEYILQKNPSKRRAFTINIYAS